MVLFFVTPSVNVPLTQFFQQKLKPRLKRQAWSSLIVLQKRTPLESYLSFSVILVEIKNVARPVDIPVSLNFPRYQLIIVYINSRLC